jgi:uncharacterized protein YbjT (DUF2867 family)
MPARTKRKKPGAASLRVQRARVDEERVAELLDVANPCEIAAVASADEHSRRCPNLLGQLRILEQELSTLPMPITFLRPAWFIEKFSWDIPPACETGVIPSFLQPLDKLFPMVATEDVGTTAAELLRDSWAGLSVVELEGPARVSPQQAAEIMGKLLGRQVRIETVPRDTWESLFLSQGMKNPTPRIQMLDGFNEGWIEFDGNTQRQAHSGKCSGFDYRQEKSPLIQSLVFECRELSRKAFGAFIYKLKLASSRRWCTR